MASISARRDGKVLIVELKRPEAGNALSREVQTELSEIWQDLESAEDVSVGVLHGAGGVFSIGHDREELRQIGPAGALPDEAMFPFRLRKPVIAATEGPCYGLGFELALSCDLRVAAEGSLFGFPDRNLLVPYRLASVLLPRMTFLGISEELLFAGRVMDSVEMRKARIVNVKVERGAALDAAIAAAREMAERAGSPKAFRKRATWQLSGLPLPYAMSVVREQALAR